MPRNYDLLAVDLDGTLLDHEGNVPARNLRALDAAREAGITVVVCTGRALHESRHILRAIKQTQPVVVSGGAMVACPATGKTLERFTIDQPFVREVVSYLHDRGHPALLLKDPHATGYDYLAVSPRGESALDPASRWWLRKMRIPVRHTVALEHDEHPEHTVRVGVYKANAHIDDLAADMHTRFGERASLQHFHGALLPKDRVDDGIESVHIVEVFHAQACKWQAISRYAARAGISPQRIAAVGDQLNDLSMIASAGLGVAMGNAHPRVTAAAKRTTLRCEEAGVAHAVEQILSGAW